MDASALELLEAYDWPGNVRQLVNAARRLTVTAPGRTITLEDISADIGGRRSAQKGLQEWTRSLASWASTQLGAEDNVPLVAEALPQFEKTLITAALEKTRGRRQEAAKLLGWGRNTLTRKMKALHLD